MDDATGPPRSESLQDVTFPLPDQGADRPGGGGSPALRAGETLASRYRIVRFIARGGGGEVYEAADLELGGRVASQPGGFYQRLD